MPLGFRPFWGVQKVSFFGHKNYTLLFYLNFGGVGGYPGPDQGVTGSNTNERKTCVFGTPPGREGVFLDPPGT